MNTEQKPLNSGFGVETTAAEIVAPYNLQGKVIIVTGGHSGIGLETTRTLSEAGASIIVGSRDLEKAQQNLANIRNVTVIPLDLADPASIDHFAKEFLVSHATLDILINNAGIMATPLMRDPRGYEMQFATNHLGHFQLTSRLWEALKRARQSRVVTLTSFGHRFGGVDLDDPNFLNRPYDKWKAYGQSKSANSLFSVELDRQGQTDGIRAFAVHPGRIVTTDLMRHMADEELKGMGMSRDNGTIKAQAQPNGVPVKNEQQGAATTVWCAVSSQLDDKGGVYCADCDISPLVPDDSPDPAGVRRWAVDQATATALWELSEQLT